MVNFPFLSSFLPSFCGATVSTVPTASPSPSRDQTIAMARSLSRLQVIFLFALAVHVSTVRSAPRVAVEDEKRVGVKTSREVDKYVKLYASDTGPAPEFVCLITVVSVSDCEEYFEEVSAFVKTARGIITKAPAVQEGPMSLLFWT